MTVTDEPFFAVEERVAFVRQLAREEGQDEAVTLPGLDGATLFGLPDGALVLNLACKGAQVDTETSHPHFTVEATAEGALVQIHERIPTSTASAAIADIISRVRSGEPRGQVPRRVLEDFALLLSSADSKPLGDKRLVGLIGELEILEMLLKHGGHLSHWTGWDRDKLDFRLPNQLAVEVKSTLSADYRRVHVHGLAQLDDPADGSELLLVLWRFERSPDGRSLPEIVDQLLAMGVAGKPFFEALSNAGYHDHHRPHYSNKRYIGRQRALRRIDDDHPRLVPKHLAEVDMSAIERIDYVLDLDDSAAEDLDADLEDILQRHLEQA